MSLPVPASTQFVTVSSFCAYTTGRRHLPANLLNPTCGIPNDVLFLLFFVFTHLALPFCPPTCFHQLVYPIYTCSVNSISPCAHDCLLRPSQITTRMAKCKAQALAAKQHCLDHCSNEFFGACAQTDHLCNTSSRECVRYLQQNRNTYV